MGRSAPEIDNFEATDHGNRGAVSQSGQWAPFNVEYEWFNKTVNFVVPDLTFTESDSYVGGASFCFPNKQGLTKLVYPSSVFQQAISAVSTTS